MVKRPAPKPAAAVSRRAMERPVGSSSATLTQHITPLTSAASPVTSPAVMHPPRAVQASSAPAGSARPEARAAAAALARLRVA